MFSLSLVQRFGFPLRSTTDLRISTSNVHEKTCVIIEGIIGQDQKNEPELVTMEVQLVNPCDDLFG